MLIVVVDIAGRRLLWTRSARTAGPRGAPSCSMCVAPCSSRGDSGGLRLTRGGLGLPQGAGHMAAYTQPARTLEMVTRWVNNQPL